MSAGRRRLVTDIAEQNPGTGTRVRDMKVVVMSKAEQIVAGLGGADNIDEVEACITRLRVEVGDENLVDEAPSRRRAPSASLPRALPCRSSSVPKPTSSSMTSKT